MKVQKRADDGREGIGTETFHICDCCGSPASYSVTGVDLSVNGRGTIYERTVDVCSLCYNYSSDKRNFSKPPTKPTTKAKKGKKPFEDFDFEVKKDKARKS